MKQSNQGKRLVAALAKKAKPTKIPLSALFLVVSVFAVGSILVFTYKVMTATVTLDGRPLKTAVDAHLPPRSAGAKRTSSINNNNNGMKVPSPVFVTGLPKSGTTSTWKYFLCGLGSGKAAHQWAQVAKEDSEEKSNNSKKEQVRLGKCLEQNMKNNRPLLQGCGDYHVWTDMGVIAPGTCFYPSIHGGLEALYKDYPQATLLSVVRDTESWVNSTTQFNSLWDRWIANKCDKFPGKGSTRQDYAKFYDWHTQMVRQFAKDHPSMTFIEVTLEGNDTGRILEEATGLNASCWVHSKTKKGPRAKPKWLKDKERREQESGKQEQHSGKKM